MNETLYKTSSPEEEKSECCEIFLEPLPGSGTRVYTFSEDHGWWDESTKKFVHQVTRINTTEEGVTYEEAHAMYLKAKTKLAQSGFIHSFAPDPYSYKSHKYEFIQTRHAG
ncbi:MAG: hypothetical protein WCA10_23670 [Terracidiphilus sp.]